MVVKAIEKQILFEDNHILLINKKIGDLVQGDKTGDISLDKKIKIYLKQKYNKQGNVYLGVMHRLDRPTSGIVIFAKTSKALKRLNKMLKERKIQKTYWAIVKNAPKKTNDTLVHYLKKNIKTNKSTVFNKPTNDAKKSVLHYKIIQKLNNYTLLEIVLETGRHHQIRAQLAYIKCAIKGDLKYGAKRSNPNGGIHLHARKIDFMHPVTKKPVEITAPTPKDVIWDHLSQ